MDKQRRYVIVGSGVAGISAAEEIRRWDGRGHITLIGDEPYYYRASLSEWLAGRATEEMLSGRTPDFYAQMRLERLDGRVTQVDPNTRQVVLDDGQTRPYDRLLLSTGARANTVPIPGLASEDLCVFRSWPDARTLQERIGSCGRILILGGGVLGLELAGALVELGRKRVAVVQRGAHVGSPLLDEAAALWLQGRMCAAGVDLFLNDTVLQVEGHHALLRSGRGWDFDLLVQSIGVTPEFPPVPGLDVGRGIRIGPSCRTNLEGIHAAGDCTETLIPDGEGWATTRTWLESARQGRVAGRNMARGVDDAPPLSPPQRGGGRSQAPFYNASVLFDTRYSYIGKPFGAEGVTRRWETDSAYRQFRSCEGQLVGALLLGNRRGGLAIYQAIGQDVAPYGEAIARPDFPWNALTGSDWDYVFY